MVVGLRDGAMAPVTVIGIERRGRTKVHTGQELALAQRRHGDTRPMRSPSAGSVEDSSSARFQPSRWSNPPDGIPPVEGLRMRQVFEHEPVMEAEVVALFAPVPPGVVIDAKGEGARAQATVDFESVGKKSLLLSATPLRRA